MDDPAQKQDNFFSKVGKKFKSNKAGEDIIEQEIISMVNEGQSAGAIEASEAELIANIFEYTDKEARDVMTRRGSIHAIDATCKLKDVVNIMLHESFSRYPVYLDNVDHIIGMIHLKDACRELADEPENGDLMLKQCKGVMREAIFVPETKSIHNLFSYMQNKKIHMVIVVDEYGQTAGLVAMEDIVEEIMGNIFDEYDDEDAKFKKKGQDKYEVDGLIKLDELAEKIPLDFSDVMFETLSGLMVSRLERIPKDGEQFEMDFGSYHFKALNVKDKVIRRVLITEIKEQGEVTKEKED